MTDLGKCSGAGDCTASPHIHGCYADFGDCNRPEEHGYSWVMDAEAFCDRFLQRHVFRHGWGRCTCKLLEWPGEEAMAAGGLRAPATVFRLRYCAGCACGYEWQEGWGGLCGGCRRAEILERERDKALDRITDLEVEVARLGTEEGT